MGYFGAVSHLEQNLMIILDCEEYYEYDKERSQIVFIVPATPLQFRDQIKLKKNSIRVGLTHVHPNSIIYYNFPVKYTDIRFPFDSNLIMVYIPLLQICISEKVKLKLFWFWVVITIIRKYSYTGETFHWDCFEATGDNGRCFNIC